MAPAHPPEERLLLEALRRQPRPEVVADLVRCGLDWTRVTEGARRHRVRPLLMRALSPHLALLPEPIAEVVGSGGAISRSTALAWAAELVRLSRSFRAAGVELLAVKGPLLATIAYGDLGAREYGDLDLVVRPSAFAEATDLLRAAGYQPAFDIAHVVAAARDGRGPLPHEVAYSSGERRVVDLHIGLLPHHLAVDVEADFRSRLQRVPLAGEPLLTLAKPDLLIYVCAHGLQDGWSRLSWVADVAWLASDPDIELSAVLDTAGRYGARRLLLLGLGLARGLAGLEVSTDVARELDEAPVRALIERVERVIFSQALSRPGWRRSVVHLRARERVADRVRYLARLPGDVALGDLTSVRLPPALFPLYFALRPIRLAYRYRTGQG